MFFLELRFTRTNHLIDSQEKDALNSKQNYNKIVDKVSEIQYSSATAAVRFWRKFN